MSTKSFARGCVCASLLLQFVVVLPARADEFESWKTPSLYSFAETKLKDGRSLSQAIQALEIACKREPDNLDFNVALGCAYSSRYASVAMAWKQSQRYPNDVAYYESRRKKWEEAHASGNRPEAQRPPPARPPVPSTPDDNIPFTMREDEAVLCLRKLGNEAQKAFAEAISLAKDGDETAVKQVAAARGWGLLLIKRFGRGVVQDNPPDPKNSSSPNILYIPDEDIIESFRSLTELDPDDSKNWCSLAVALARRYLNLEHGIAGTEGLWAVESPVQLKAAREAIRRSLALRPNDFQALYVAALLYRASDLEEAIRLFQRAADHSGGNAVLTYMAAELLFARAQAAGGEERTRVEARAWDAVSRGSKARRYTSVRLVFPAPPLLRSAWKAAAPYGVRDDYVVMQLGIHLHEISKAADVAGDDDLLLKSANAQISMSLKVLEASRGEDLDYRDSTARLIYSGRRSHAATFILGPFSIVRSVNKKRPDPRKERFLAEHAALVHEVREWERNSDN